MANVDASIGRVLQQVRGALPGEVGVIVVSDHGESLYDQGFLGHGYALDEAQTRIPLVVENVPMVMEQPWGQAQLRHELGAALRHDPGGPVRPMVSTQSRGVFQYLGGLGRPRQIAWRTAANFVAYDVRDRRPLVDSTDRGEATRTSASKSMTDLVHLWERMRLAMPAGRN